MALHLIKLCVGADSVQDLKDWQDHVVSERKRADEPPFPTHTTRMSPKRADELLQGGSLYWVIKRVIQVRQRILGLDDIVDRSGTKRCVITLDPELVLTQPAPRKAFQGWRYLTGADAPADLTTGGGGGAELPEALRRRLLELGAW